MGSTERRAREKENLRRAIMDAARELFATQDYRAVSMRRIAEKVEYSPTALYLHFKDKDAILGELIREGFDMLNGWLRGIAPTDDPVERLRRAARCYYAFALEQPHYYRLMFQLQDHDLMEATMPTLDTEARGFGFVLECVAVAQGRGQFRRDLDVNVLAHIIWAALHGVVTLVLSGHVPGMLPPEQRDEFLEGMIEVTLAGCGATPRA